MRLLRICFKVILRIFVFVLIGGIALSSLMDFTYSAFSSNNPNLLITINENGNITYNGNLFQGQLFPSTEQDAEKGIGGIVGVIRIENKFRKIDVDNLAIGISSIEVDNNYTNDYVYNSFINNVSLKIEKGKILIFNTNIVEFTKLKDILYEVGSNEYRGYNINSGNKFSINKNDTVDLRYTLHMDSNAGEELEAIKADMPIYINLKETHIIDDDDDDEIVIIEDKEVPVDILNRINHFQYIQGYPDNTVRPEGLITREEVAAVFYRLLTSKYRMSILTNEVNFIDVESGRWSIRHIASLKNGKIISGYPGNSFKPSNPITRAELAAIASRFDKLSTIQGESFSDIDGHWALDYINSAAAKGWVNGYPDKTFKPDKYITRAEFVTLVNNVLGRKVHSDNILEGIMIFSDLNENMWYYEDIVEATNSHIYIKDGNTSIESWIEIIFPDLDL